ncbi:MAG: ATP-binding cassette domain-containing protein [Bacilli bacterium]|nr:ATP-binding cassette domain-containing protein [Bacilli bacterium]
MLSFKNVTKVFYKGTADEKVALNNVSFTINDGEFVTIIGGNGSGKSTTLNVLTGNMNPDKGAVLLNDVDITNMPENKRAKYFARVFQDTNKGTAGSMQVIENLAIASRKGGHNGLGWYINKEQKQKYIEMLKSFNLGLETRLTTKTSVLSGGQRQALTLLMATLRAEPSHKQIIKDYSTFYMGDKEQAKQEVTKVYDEAKQAYKEALKELSKEKLSYKEKRAKKRALYDEFDAKIRKYDLTKQILLLDEHTAALDPKTAKKVLALTEKIVRENKLTTLMVTHNMRDALTYGDRLIMFYEGKIIHDISGKEKQQLTVEQLLNMFDEAEAQSINK